MRVFLHLAFVPLVVLLIASCSEDPVPASANIAWRVRCDIEGGCSRNEDHEIRHTNGEDGNQVSCSITDGGGMASVFFRAYFSDEYGIQVRNLTVPSSGGSAIGTSCRVTVLEQSEDYVGTCGSGVPSDAQPCRIREVVLDGSTVSGKLICSGLPSDADLALKREVTAPGPGAAGTEVDFMFENCE